MRCGRRRLRAVFEDLRARFPARSRPGTVGSICAGVVALACGAGGPAEPQPGPLPPPPPPGLQEAQGWSPAGSVVCDEAFTSFADWNDFTSGARCVYRNMGQLDRWGRRNVDVDASGLMYRFRALPDRCGDQIVGQATIPLPSGTREVWMEWDAVFSANFRTENPNCSSPAPDFKYVLVWLDDDVTCGNRRGELKMGTLGGQISAATIGFPQCDEVEVNSDGSTATVRQPGARSFFDGEPHHYRFALRMLGVSRYSVYLDIDGVVKHDYVTTSIPDDGLAWDRIFLGSNRNLGATSDMFLHWRNMKVWAR